MNIRFDGDLMTPCADDELPWYQQSDWDTRRVWHLCYQAPLAGSVGVWGPMSWRNVWSLRQNLHINWPMWVEYHA